MTDTKGWRDAKLPQWARDAVQSEINQWRMTAALAWPNEAKPQPLPFMWTEYDQLIGTPESGRYWVASRKRIEAFDLLRVDELPTTARAVPGQTWNRWAFRTFAGGDWHTTIQRGLLFATERDAKLYRHWLMCEDFARQLMQARDYSND